MYDGFRSLKNIVDASPELESIKKAIKESDVISQFFQIFPELEKVVVPVKVEKKILKMKVENAAWRSEIKFNEKSFVDKINLHFKDHRVNQIRFV